MPLQWRARPGMSFRVLAVGLMGLGLGVRDLGFRVVVAPTTH